MVPKIRLPWLRAGSRSTYLNAMDRAAWAFFLLDAAASETVLNDASRQRMVLSGVAPVPWRAASAECELVGASVGGNGQDVDVDLVARGAAAAFEGAQPLSDNGSRVRLRQGLIRQAQQAVPR